MSDTVSGKGLGETAQALVVPGKGVLAADERPAAFETKLGAAGIGATPETIRAWRELLFHTPEIETGLSGVILWEDAFERHAGDRGSGAGRSFADILAARGMIPGVNADLGPHPLAGAPGEYITEGLDGLRHKLARWAGLGARFTKWRAMIAMGPDRPGRAALRANAHAMARLAALSQEAGLVPVVEPDVLMTGAHDLAACGRASERIWRALYEEMDLAGVCLEGSLLKTNMIMAGTDAAAPTAPATVAEATLAGLRRCIPAAVPGILFLSGGQSAPAATLHLDLMNRGAHQPWALTFSYSRAIEAPVMQIWGGRPENVAAARAAFLHRVRMNAAAAAGRYDPAMDNPAMDNPAMDDPAIDDPARQPV